MIRSMLKQLQLGGTDQSLLSFVDKAMGSEKHKNLLESHYSQELSLLYILQEDYDRAKYYTNNAMNLFMEVCFNSSLLKKHETLFQLYSYVILLFISLLHPVKDSTDVILHVFLSPL